MSEHTQVGSTGRLSTLYDITQLISSSLDLDVVLQWIMDAVVVVTGAERGFVLLVEPDGSLREAIACNVGPATEADRPSRSLCQQVIQSGGGVLIADALADEVVAQAQSVTSLRLRSVLCAPLLAKSKTIGVIYLDHRMETSRFHQGHLDLLEAVGKQAGIAIENARLYEQLRTHADRLGSLKAYQDNLLGSVATTIVGLDLQGRVLSMNRAGEELFGVPEAEATGRRYPEILGQTLGNRLLRSFGRAAMGREAEVFTTGTEIKGSERHLRCSVSSLRDADDKLTGLIFLAEDETARMLAERAREREEAERARIRDLFGRFVAEPVVEQLLTDPAQAQLGGVRREVTVVFTDVRGYTTFAEQSTPEQVVATLGRYLAVAADTIMEQGGTLDKFQGDGVMALFNAPLDQPDHALAAVRAAWLMQRRAGTEVEGISFGAGVNTGDALVGNFGTERFRNYSCIGDVVNVTARLQGLAQGGEVLITASTLERVRDHVKVEALGGLEVKGRSAPVDTYRVLEVQL